MKLLSEYMSDDEKKTAKVYQEANQSYIVIVKDDVGSFYRTKFISERLAEDFAEDWVL